MLSCLCIARRDLLGRDRGNVRRASDGHCQRAGSELTIAMLEFTAVVR
jgi:hypothetical protein